MTQIYAITDLATDSDAYIALQARVDIIQPEDLDTWVPADSKVLLRQRTRPFRQEDDFRIVPSLTDRIAISKENQRLRAATGDQPGANCCRFFMAGKAYFAVSDVAGGIGFSHNEAAWSVAAYVDQHVTYPFWALDVAWLRPGFAVVAIHDGITVSLGSTLPPDAFYQALVAKLTGSCCR